MVDATMSDYPAVTPDVIPAETSRFSLPSNYNSGSRAAANLVEGVAVHAIRAPKTADMIHGEAQ
jgi:hypothetical protein